MALIENMKKIEFATEIYRRLGFYGVGTALLVIAFLAVPLLPGRFPIVVATEILILGLFAMSFNLIYGYMGQISFGHGAFFGLGAYATALLFRAFQVESGGIGYVSFFISMLLAIPVSALFGLIVGFFCVRLTGIYFAMLSLAFGELLFYIVFSWYSFTKGDDGIQGIMPPAFFSESVHYYYFTLLVVGIAVLLLWRITRSPFGYSLRMLRDNQQRAAFLGINVRQCMLVNFIIASTFAGIAGALWCPFQRSVSPGLLGWMESGTAIFMTLIGGGSFFGGPMVGSIIYTFLNSYVTQYTVYWPLTMGIIILLIVRFLPGGLLSVIGEKIVVSPDYRELQEVSHTAPGIDKGGNS